MSLCPGVGYMELMPSSDIVRPVPVAARSEVYVCGRSPAGIVDSNLTRGIYDCLLWVLCVVRLLNTRPEESYRLWCVVLCDLETS